METLRLSDIGVETAAQKAAAVLRAGGVILYPTDTIYGLGTDALSNEAIRKVQVIKGRDEKKPMHAIVADLESVAPYATLNSSAQKLAETFWPGALTLILQKKSEVSTGIAKNIDTFGVRVPNNPFCLALAREFGKPYTTTSANKSGEESKRSIPEILAQLGESAANIDLIIDAGESPLSLPSTIVGVHTGAPVIMREGAIPTEEIKGALGIK